MNDSAPMASAPETPTLICATRHGETDWNVLGILQGWTDVPLNDRGREQSRELAGLLAAVRFDAIWASPLRRAAETAEILAERWGLPAPSLHEGLMERHFGRLQGLPKRQLAHLHPGLHEEILRRNPACAFEEGESLAVFATRVLGALDAIAARHRGGRVLIVTHGWTMDAILRHVSGRPWTALLNLKHRNGESIWFEARAGVPGTADVAPACRPLGTGFADRASAPDADAPVVHTSA